MRLPGVERIADLSYGDAGERNLLDLYRARTPGRETPRVSRQTADSELTRSRIEGDPPAKRITKYFDN